MLVLPNGQDPDDFVRANGAEAYNEARGRALPFLNFALDASVKGRSINNPKQKAEAIEEMMPVLSAIKNPIQKRESFDQSMEFFRIEDDGLKRELWHSVKSGQRSDTEVFRIQARRAARMRVTLAEQHLLELLAHDKELRAMILPALEESDYENLATAPVFRAMYSIDENGFEMSLENLVERLPDDELAADFVPLLMLGEPKRQPGEVIDEVLHDAENCVLSLRSMAIQNHIHEVSQRLISAEQVGNSGLVNQLVAEQLELSKMMQSMLSKIRQT